MKKILLVLLVLFLIPCLNVYGQMPVVDAMLNFAMEKSGIAQGIYYAQQLMDNVTQIGNFVTMIENTGRQIDMAAQNLAAAKDIKSWDDFMGWYNRQLYLEQAAMNSFDNMSVKIGKKDYKLTDVQGMADGLKDAHIDYWNKEFTEDQRREMWLELGLTPANYAYVQPFRAKAREIGIQGLTAVEIQNDWYTRNMRKNEERQKKLAEDHLKSEQNQMGSKEILMMMLESLLETNKVTNDMAMNQAKDAEKNAVDDAINNAPSGKTPPGVWTKNGYEKF